MNAALFTKSTTGLILASGLIAASSILGHAQDAPMALGAPATIPLSAWYVTTPTGQATLGGHTFDMTSGNMIGLVNGGSASFAGSYQNAKAVYLLLNTANTYSYLYAGSPVGTVVLTFSDNTTQNTDLIVGVNLREWRTGAPSVVNTVSDPATAPVWTTTAQTSMGGGTAVLDMLTIPVTTTGKTLTKVTLNDTNSYGSLQIDLAGLTADFTPPAPPTPAPTPTPTAGGGTGAGHDEDRAGNDQEDHHSGADKAEKDADKADKNHDKDSHKAAVKRADKHNDKKTTSKKSGDHERNGDD
jgi:hypothetical protein